MVVIWQHDNIHPPQSKLQRWCPCNQGSIWQSPLFTACLNINNHPLPELKNKEESDCFFFPQVSCTPSHSWAETPFSRPGAKPLSSQHDRTKIAFDMDDLNYTLKCGTSVFMSWLCYEKADIGKKCVGVSTLKNNWHLLFYADPMQESYACRGGDFV